MKFAKYFLSRIMLLLGIIVFVISPMYFIGLPIAEYAERKLNFGPDLDIREFLVFLTIGFAILIPCALAFDWVLKKTGLSESEAYRALNSGNIWARPKALDKKNEAPKDPDETGQ